MFAIDQALCQAIYVHYLNPHNNFINTLLSPYYRWGNSGLVRVNNLPTVTKPAFVRVRIRVQVLPNSKWFKLVTSHLMLKSQVVFPKVRSWYVYQNENTCIAKIIFENWFLKSFSERNFIYLALQYLRKVI